ncbi:MAG: hypothetical protein AAFR71_09450 [Pseudomonadota bacterium]
MRVIRKSAVCITLGLLVATAIVSNAANVPFSALINTPKGCTLVVLQDGILAADASGQILSSKNVGGTSGSVLASTTNASFSAAVEAPTAFATSPAGGNDSVSFNVTYSGTGDTTIPETVSTVQTRLKRGDTYLTVDMAASQASGSSPNGNYSAVVTERCE